MFGLCICFAHLSVVSKFIFVYFFVGWGRERVQVNEGQREREGLREKQGSSRACVLPKAGLELTQCGA